VAVGIEVARDLAQQIDQLLRLNGENDDRGGAHGRVVVVGDAETCLRELGEKIRTSAREGDLVRLTLA
jgi:hypothetical protein